MALAKISRRRNPCLSPPIGLGESVPNGGTTNARQLGVRSTLVHAIELVTNTCCAVATFPLEYRSSLGSSHEQCLYAYFYRLSFPCLLAI